MQSQPSFRGEGKNIKHGCGFLISCTNDFHVTSESHLASNFTSSKLCTLRGNDDDCVLKFEVLHVFVDYFQSFLTYLDPLLTFP